MKSVGACAIAVDAAVQERGPRGKVKRSCTDVGEGRAKTFGWDRLSVEVTAGSATSWDRPAERSYLVKLCRDELSVIVGWGLSRQSAESLAERLVELLGLKKALPGRPAA
ncbi:MAG: hypothetical protein ACP5VR_11200 [Acidimicrobiales bacterium]